MFCYTLWRFPSYSGEALPSAAVQLDELGFSYNSNIFCCFPQEAILTWSLTNDINGLPTALINSLWHLPEQTVILLWSWTHHHQLEKKMKYPIGRHQANNFTSSFSYEDNQSVWFIEKGSSFSRTAFLAVWFWFFCFLFFLNQLRWQLFPCDSAQGYLSELRVHWCWKIYFKANKNTKHLILK